MRAAQRGVLGLLGWSACALFTMVALASGCGGSSLAAPPNGADGSTDPNAEAGSSTDEGGSSSGDAGDLDAALPPGVDAAVPVFGDDGTPTRVACVSTLGMGLSPVHGRLDGTLVSIVPEKGAHCPSDSTHLHLQVKMGASVYDIAVNLDGFEGELDAPLPGAPYAEGWHPMNLDYPTNFGLHSTSLTTTGSAAVRARVVSQLTNANHISVFGTGYPGSDGAHLIHRNPSGHDGALVIDPLAAKAHVLAFRFANDTF